MPLEIEKKNKKSPHLALTHQELQNGAANGRNISLLMKSDVEITEEIAVLIEKITGEKPEVAIKENVEKASVETTRKLLNEQIKKFNRREYSWSYVEDFDEQYVVFTNDDGLFYTTYESTAEGVVVGDTATSVNRIVSYREDSGTLILSEDNDVNSSVQSLIVKSFDSIQKNEKLVDIIKSIQEKGKLMEDIQKAVEEATSTLKADLEKANATIAELQKAAKEASQAQRKEKVSAVISDEAKVEELLKATESLEDEAFNIIIKSFQEKAEVIEKSDLFKRESSQEDIEKADAEPLHVQLLKKQHNVS